MLKSIKSLFVLGVGVVMISGCAADTGADETVTSANQALDSCTGVTMQKWEHLANLAVATAQEMGQLNATQQFALGAAAEGGTIVTLSTYGAAFCAAKGGCPMVQSLLDIQEMPNDVYVPQALFNTIDYRNTLVDGYYRAQTQMYSYLSNNAFSQLAEDHSATLVGTDGTATCGTPWYSFSVKRDFHITFSSSGPVAGMVCTQITEPNDPHGWDNNYLCSERNLGIKWSSSGAIAGMTCINVTEGYDTDGWSDNYLCTPEDWGLTWSMNGIKSGKKCISVNEPSEPSSHGWANNYLCWDPNANLSHPASLCDEFLMFGGASACNGNNPYIDFSVSTDLSKIKIDPTDYTSGTVSTGSTGSCVTTLPYSSTAAVAGSCCYVTSTGLYGVLTRYPLKSNLYYCKTS